MIEAFVSEDKRAIVCNYIADTSPVSKGSLCYVTRSPGLPEF